MVWSARRLAVGVGALVVLAGCGGTTAAGSRIALASCTVQGVPARCGQLTVPENPAAPGGRKISLHVVVLPAHSPKHAADPLFYFAGGPGGAATDSTSWAYKNFFVLNDQHDIVLIDQRGTGRSNETTCALDYSSFTDESISAGIASCLESTKDEADASMYTTPLAVDDFDEVRAALGYDRIDVYGVSYGVSSGLSYVQRHGDRVRTAMFDSGSLLDVHLWERVPISAQNALDELFARCAADSACSAAFPNVKAELASLTARLATGPMQVGYIDATTGTKRSITVELVSLLNFIIDGYLADMRTAAALPKAIHTAAAGDWSDFVHAYQSSAQGGPDKLMSLTVICSDAWATYDPNTIRAIAGTSMFTPEVLWQANFINTECRYWPHAEGASGPVTSTAPIVFLNGTADPADPPANVAGASATMPNSLSLTFPAFGHGIFNQDESGCLARKAAAFVDAGRPSTQADWGPCLLLPPPFVTE